MVFKAHNLTLLACTECRRLVAVFCLCGAIVLSFPLISRGETEVRMSNTSGGALEQHLPLDEGSTSWVHDPAIFAEDEGDITENRETVAKVANTVKLDNLVPAIHFELGRIDIPDNYLNLLRKVLDDMRDRVNVRLHFIGHADSLPLGPELQAIYGDNVGLSRERAGNVAEYCQKALNLPPEAISYEGLGYSQPLADNTSEEGRARNRRVEVQVWYDVISEKTVQEEVVVARPKTAVNRVKVCRTETVCKLRYKEGHAHRARVRNLIIPLRYDPAALQVSDPFIQQVRQAMTDLGGRDNLVIKFIAYTDNLPLSDREERIYGNHAGLSKAVARRVALVMQEALQLPNAAIDTEGRGASRPLASNQTQQGRALNRRVEVEFWYDDPLQELPDEPQLCPDASGVESVTRVHLAASGPIEPIVYRGGNPVVPEGYTERLRRMMNEVREKNRVRLRFVGYTGNERLDRRTAAVYGDDICLSLVRARRAMEAVREKMGLSEEQVEFDGRGYVQSDDVVNAGFITSGESRVEIQVVYDEPAILDDYEGVEITPMTREVTPANPFALNLMRITVDGKPVDDPGKCSSDVQRCTDVALERADIQFKHDSLKLERRLNISAWPTTIRYQDLGETPFPENLVNFRLYANYRSFLERGEVRIFEEEQSLRDVPLAVVELDADGRAQWRAEFAKFSAPLKRLKYLVRVYDRKGRFDETKPQPLWVTDTIDTETAGHDVDQKLLAGYGENRISLSNIPLSGGAVQAQGSSIPAGHGVWMAGYAVPVDTRGRFVAEEILPEGVHTVEVAVLDEFGNGELFLRDLELKKSDWFTVGMADLTLSGNQTNGPASLLQPDNPRYSEDFSLQGRLAFYTNGKFKNGWTVTGSADTREGTVEEIFSNFIEKSTEAQLQRIDPDYHYPTFGDDGTMVEDAPTDGKFYVKAKKNETYGLWGNYMLNYSDTDLARIDRQLYGAKLHYQPLETTSFGQPRYVVDGFGADPGTVSGTDVLRGTGGSLYYLSRKDVLEGSETLRIEVRDKDSGLVLARETLTAGSDYDIDYIQGRILLSEVLPSTASDDLLVSTSSLSGNPVYLVVNYEYTPGVDDPDTLITGGRAHYWLNDYIKMGATAYRDEEDGVESTLGGLDLTLRKSSSTWLRLEGGHSEGPGVFSSTSNDGGYSFSSPDEDTSDEDVAASSYRVEGSLGLSDIWKKGRGRITFYLQDLEAGYSSPGLSTEDEITQFGGTIDLPISDHLNVLMKVDAQKKPEGLDKSSAELNLNYRFADNWTLSPGLRHESRQDNSETVAATQEEGDRTDAVVRLAYDSHARWTAYSFLQQTVQATGNRDNNNRIGAGGSWRFNDRLNLLGELSSGDLGMGASLGSEYLYSDRTTMYLKYSLDSEKDDDGLLTREGTMTSGFRTRYSERTSIYFEEQYEHGDVPTGLVHSAGVDFKTANHLNFGANLDYGTLKDPDTAAEIERRAASVSAVYSLEKFKISSALEYRVDNTEDEDDGSWSKRTAWLFKNSFSYKVSPDWRFLGKFNYSVSESSLGSSYNSDYTKAVLGGAYRPVNNDRLNALFKYTYFNNLPASDDSISSSSSNVIQRSHIGSVDIMYDLTQRWTVGGKYAYRHGQVALDSDNPEYYASRAHLVVLRADWHFLHKWDALMEVRQLDLPDAQDRRSGALVALYRHLGNHFKVGVGYNFCDFSDDLTQQDYRHQGLFINIVGKM
ncbi:MAG: OmpA family protein [Deltaproteobacteria bacterium]|nr:OmpA family protein [Deltaproteobacteria bacterium]